ncbi:hypothetical protein MMC26_005779 [Xylographa opegraphella]|nr:hypothetical protein [Xylographa opegraphella]
MAPGSFTIAALGKPGPLAIAASSVLLGMGVLVFVSICVVVCCCCFPLHLRSRPGRYAVPQVVDVLYECDDDGLEIDITDIPLYRSREWSPPTPFTAVYVAELV